MRARRGTRGKAGQRPVDARARGTVAALAAMRYPIAILCLLTTLLHAGTLIEDGYRAMYNLQFDRAHSLFAQWERSHPGDPLAPVSDAAAYLFSELDRLHILQAEFFTHDENFRKRERLSPDPAVKQKFEGSLAKSQ